MRWVVRAWQALQADRAYAGMAGVPMPLTFLAIDTYARRFRIEGEQFETLHTLLQAMDRTYLEYCRERQEQKTPKKKPPTGGRQKG